MHRSVQDELTHFKRLRNESERSGLPHGDLCPKLLLHGVEFALPIRADKVRPCFGPEGITAQVAEQEQWPEISALVDAVGESAQMDTCPTCGQGVNASLTVDMTWASDVLGGYFALAARALRERYALTDEQLTELLEFPPGDFPIAFHQILAWANGLNPDAGLMGPMELPDGEAEADH